MNFNLFPNKEQPKQLTEEEKLKQRLAEIEAAKQQPRPELRPAPEPKPRLDAYNSIPKKTAALEVYNRLKWAGTVAMGSIVSVFVILILNSFSFMFAAVGVIAYCIPVGIYAQKVRQDMIRLKNDYNL